MKYYAGVDLGGTEIKIGVINVDGLLPLSKSFKTEGDLTAVDFCAYLSACINRTIKESGVSRSDIRGVGIGSPGLLNPETGQLKIVTNIPILNGFYLAPALAEKMGLPVFLENDVNAMTFGEYCYGAARGYDNIVAITIGTGVGGGIIIGGKIYRGKSFTAGEIGHLSIDPDGLFCPCGNYGCLERYIGRDGIVMRFNAYFDKGVPSIINDHLDNGEITPKAVTKAAEAGDALAIEVLAKTGDYLGMALALLVNLLNPDMIVIGGGIANAGAFLIEPAQAVMIRRAYAIPVKDVKIVPAQLKNDAGIIGAASIVVERLGK